MKRRHLPPQTSHYQRWIPREQQLKPLLNQNQQSWLFDQGSLSQRLDQRSDGHFSVTVQQQGFSRPRIDECRALNIRADSWALIREVCLYGGDTPWVFARSVIPITSITGSLAYLKRLANRSLGSELFKDPHLQRSHFELIHDHAQNLELPTAFSSDQLCWGRRSVFHLRNKPLLVAEIFLPEFEDMRTQG